jgi:hypothetical protein
MVIEGIGNISSEPLFSDPANLDFHLQSGSPCSDAGHPSVFYHDKDGSRNDMGRYGGSGICITPNELEFGPAHNGQSMNKVLYIQNLRNTSLELNSASLTDQDNFTLEFDTPSIIPSFSLDSLIVTFHPISTGPIQEQVLLNSPDFSGTSTASVELSGYGGVWGGDVSGTWSLEESPHFIGTDIIIPFGETLTIEPGVIVQVDNSFSDSPVSIIVEGSFLPKVANPIQFNLQCLRDNRYRVHGAAYNCSLHNLLV